MAVRFTTALTTDIINVATADLLTSAGTGTVTAGVGTDGEATGTGTITGTITETGTLAGRTKADTAGITEDTDTNENAIITDCTGLNSL
jgi:hypothetical protein